MIGLAQLVASEPDVLWFFAWNGEMQFCRADTALGMFVARVLR